MAEMVQVLLTILAAIISAIVGGFLGSLLTIAKFGSKIESHSQSLDGFVRQRAEDRENERRENDRMREEFRTLCTENSEARERELNFIRRELRDFRTMADRRQRYIMDVVTSIARKEGITHRITDGLELANGEEEN